VKQGLPPLRSVLGFTGLPNDGTSCSLWNRNVCSHSRRGALARIAKPQTGMPQRAPAGEPVRHAWRWQETLPDLFWKCDVQDRRWRSVPTPNSIRSRARRSIWDHPRRGRAHSVRSDVPLGDGFRRCHYRIQRLNRKTKLYLRAKREGVHDQTL